MSRLAPSQVFRGVRPWTVLGSVLVLGLAAAFWQAALRAGTTVAAVVAVGTAAALAVVGWSAGSWLFGPVFFYEVIRTGRRSRIFLLRVCFGLCLLLFLWLIYEKFREEIEMRVWVNSNPWVTGGSWRSWRSVSVERAAMMTRLAETFFFTFTCVQFAAIFLLTPAYTAGTIAEEKDRKRFEFLLATDLTNREIVLGKLAACLANLTLVLITGLPILGMTQFLGGVDPNLVLAGFAAAGLTMLSLAALSILNSVHARKPRDAILMTYLFVIAYLLLSFFSEALIAPLNAPGSNQAFWESVTAVMESFNSGNLVLMLMHLRDDWDKGLPVAEIMPRLLRGYAIFHGLVAATCTGWAVLRMRAAAWGGPRTGTEPVARRRRRWRLFRPPLGTEPMLWKELVAEPGFAFNWAGKIVVGLIILVSFVPAVWVVAGVLFKSSGDLEQRLNTWVRLAGAGVASLTLVGVAVRAASSISSERERQTLDSLLTTQLGLRDVLFSKWLASILSVRLAWLWLIVIWVFGVLAGGLHLSTLPWLMLAWVVYAAAFASLGLWFSVVSSGTLRATLLSLCLMAVLSFGHWLPWLFIEMPHYASLVFAIQAFGLTPPAALVWLAFSENSISGAVAGTTPVGNPMAILLGIGIGLIGWAVLAYVLWRRALARFQAATGRRQAQGTRSTISAGQQSA